MFGIGLTWLTALVGTMVVPLEPHILSFRVFTVKLVGARKLRNFSVI